MRITYLVQQLISHMVLGEKNENHYPIFYSIYIDSGYTLEQPHWDGSNECPSPPPYVLELTNNVCLCKIIIWKAQGLPT